LQNSSRLNIIKKKATEKFAMGTDSKVKQEGGGILPHRGGRQHINNNANTKKSTFKSKITELEDDTFTTGHPSDAAKCERTAETITNYIQREYSAGTYLAQAIRHGGTVSIGLPTKPKKIDKADGLDQDTYDLMVFAWGKEAPGIIKNNTRIAEGNRRMFALFFEQCELAMKTKLKGPKGSTRHTRYKMA
jgi:hypothetical protein